MKAILFPEHVGATYGEEGLNRYSGWNVVLILRDDTWIRGSIDHVTSGCIYMLTDDDENETDEDTGLTQYPWDSVTYVYIQ